MHITRYPLSTPNSRDVYLRRQGFTLIEILVTISIVAMVGVIASSTLFSLFRGASKSEILKEVKQNGEFALSTMEQKVRNATSVTCFNSFSKYGISVVNQDGTTTLFECDTSNNTLTQDGNSLINTSIAGSAIKLKTCTASMFTCTPPGDPTSIIIQFDLEQANAGANTAETATSHFQTSVTLRN